MRRLFPIAVWLLCAGALFAQVQISGNATISGPTNLGIAPSASLPTPPANAVTVNNLQNLTGWHICNANTSCNAGGGGGNTYANFGESH